MSDPTPATASSATTTSEQYHEPLSSELLPTTDATLTIRIIKSFEYRTQKSMVIKGVNLEEETVGGLKKRVKDAVQITAGYKPYKTLVLDTLKLYTVAHGHKTTNLIINLDHDEWILEEDEKKLVDVGAQNETEFSFFNRAAYESFKLNPEVKWT